MLCEKCGTENREGATYCKKCGEDILTEAEKRAIEEVGQEKTEAAHDEAEDINITEEKAEEIPEKTAPVALAEESVEEAREEKTKVREEVRERTSPLAVRMKEKGIKEDKKIQKKLRRGKVWASLAVILAVLFLAENTVLVLNKLGYIGEKEEVLTEPPLVSTPETDIPEIPDEPFFLNSEVLEGEWKYTYKLKKNWDSDLSGDYETVTETIESKGTIQLIDKGSNHLAVLIIPSEMVVDGNPVDPGNNPEAFNAWYKDGNLGMQLMGNEQEFFAPGGFGSLVVNVPVSMDADGVITWGSFVTTYEKLVTEMQMKYEMEISIFPVE